MGERNSILNFDRFAKAKLFRFSDAERSGLHFFANLIS